MLKPRLKLGELLLKQNKITQEQLDKSLAFQKEKGCKLGEALIQLEAVTEQEIASALADQLNILYADAEKGLLRPNMHQGLEKLISEDYARGHIVLPLSRHGQSVTVAMADPLDLLCVDDLMKMTGCDINVAVSCASDLEKAIENFYSSKDLQMKDIEEEFILMDVDKDKGSSQSQVDVRDIFSETEAAPIVKFVDLILREAVESGASDIHIEHFEDRVSLRYRVDGMLYEASPPDPKLYVAIISRLKILSRMDIAERRLPQDAGFSIASDGKVVDVRVSTIPTIFGEKMVMRLLDPTKLPLDFGKLGFDPRDREIIEREIKRPYGMIYVTGPTGSGKSTTLYTILSSLRSPKKNIMTVEDPVEYKLDGINQVQVRPMIGLTFSNTLRSFLRQDPDVLMVGEVRDLETAQMCIRAALTGHLVLSTLHTNDAPTAVTRLMDMGLEPFLLVSSLRLIIAQRLVRRLCPRCKKLANKELDVRYKNMKLGDSEVYEAKGCEDCRFTGYRGRVGIYELLEINEEIRNMVYYRKSSDEIRKRAIEIGMRSLYHSGVEKMKQGLTSLEEVLAVTVAE